MKKRTKKLLSVGARLAAQVPNQVLPAAQNRAYIGPSWLPWVLFVLGLLELGPALIHTFAPDGGAFRIAKLPSDANRATIIGIFAWAGATQLVYALIILAIAVRYRVFIRAMLLLMLFEKSVIALNGWIFKGPAAGHHPPGLYGVLVAIPILAALFAFSFTDRREAPRPSTA